MKEEQIIRIPTDECDPFDIYAAVVRFLDDYWIESPEMERFKYIYAHESWTNWVRVDLDAGGEVVLNDRIVQTTPPLAIRLAIVVLHARMASEEAEFFLDEDVRYVIRKRGTEIERIPN